MIPAQQNPWRPLATLIPNTISVYLSRQAYEAPQPQGTGTQAPVDNKKPFKPWRDNAPLYPGSWFGQAAGPAVYTTLATDAQGQLVLAPIGSLVMLNTYSDAVIRTYREYAHLFPKGVPVLTELVLDRQIAAEFNYGSNGQFTPPPAQIASNLMLAQAPQGGDQWMVIDYQEWVRIQRAAVPQSDEQKVMRALVIGQRPDLTWAAKVSEMRAVLNTGLPVTGPVV